MATDKPRFTITLDEELYQKVVEYQKDNAFSSQSKATIDLIIRGAESLGLLGDRPPLGERVKKASPYSGEAMKLADDYDRLDSWGQRALRGLANTELARLDASPRFRMAASEGLLDIREKEQAGLDDLSALPRESSDIPG